MTAMSEITSESLKEGWIESGYSQEYLQIPANSDFLRRCWYDNIPSFNRAWYPQYPWYSLWQYSNNHLPAFQRRWDLPDRIINEIADLQDGKDIELEWQLVTTKFRVLTLEEVATFCGKPYRLLPIPALEEVAAELGTNVQEWEIEAEWKDRVRKIYKPWREYRRC